MQFHSTAQNPKVKSLQGDKGTAKNNSEVCPEEYT